MLKPRRAGSHRARSSHQFGVMLCARQAGAKHWGDLSDSPSQAKAKYQVKEGGHIKLEKTQPLICLDKHKVL